MMTVPRLLKAVVLTALLIVAALQGWQLMRQVWSWPPSSTATSGHGSAGNQLHMVAPRKEMTSGPAEEEDQSDVYVSRNSLVRDVCQRYGLTASYGKLQKAPLVQLRWLNKRSMIMCFTAKVGTSTWLSYLMNDGFPGVLEHASLLHLTAETRLVPPASAGRSERLLLLQQYGKVMTVRHPFERLVSAYLDKIRGQPNVRLPRHSIDKKAVMAVDSDKDKRQDSAFQSGQEQRAELTEPAAQQRKQQGQLKDEKKQQKHEQQSTQRDQGQPHQKSRSADTLTNSFLNFAYFLVRTIPHPLPLNLENFNHIDRHWRPYYANCAPCDIQYQYIVAMDTWEKDTRFVLDKFGLSVKQEVHANSMNASLKAKEYFKELPKSLVLNLYKRYQIDFEMFGYTTDGYL